MSWFKTEAAADGRDLMDVQSLFLTALQAASTRSGEVPKGMAMVATKGFTAPRHFYYFTPETERWAPEFLRAVRAQPCEQPTGDVSFQVGDESFRSLFEIGTV